MTDEREPDETPVSQAHVTKFLDWYSPLVNLQKFDGMLNWWTNALNTLTLGELRNGMRSVQRFSKATQLTPPQFWALCKNKADEKSIERFNVMRRKLKEGVKHGAKKR